MGELITRAAAEWELRRQGISPTKVGTEEVLESCFSGVAFGLDQDEWEEATRQLSNKLQDPVIARSVAVINTEFAAARELKSELWMHGEPPLLPNPRPQPRRQHATPIVVPRGLTGPTAFAGLPDDDEPDLPVAAVPPLFGSHTEPKSTPKAPTPQQGAGWLDFLPPTLQQWRWFILAIASITLAYVVYFVSSNSQLGDTNGAGARSPAPTAAPHAQQVRTAAPPAPREPATPAPPETAAVPPATADTTAAAEEPTATPAPPSPPPSGEDEVVAKCDLGPVTPSACTVPQGCTWEVTGFAIRRNLVVNCGTKKYRSQKPYEWYGKEGRADIACLPEPS